MTPAALRQALQRFDRVNVGHFPTPIEALQRLGAAHDVDLYVKRDDCTGFAFGGNKVRQLEFYIGAAVAAGADSVLLTSAIQSNFMRTTAAMAARFGLAAHLQLEERVPDVDAIYRANGNVLLDRLAGADFSAYPEGEDEAGADAAVVDRANRLRAAGGKPYVIPLAAGHPPIGALGYVDAAAELSEQMEAGTSFDAIVVGSGSALTHSGLLVGLRALGRDTQVLGISVRRDAASQAERVGKRAADLEAMLGWPHKVTEKDIQLYDGVLAPGYGQLNGPTRAAIQDAARLEGLFLDPVYTGKVMAGLFEAAGQGLISGKALFWHTGGQPALFAYGERLFDD